MRRASVTPERDALGRDLNGGLRPAARIVIEAFSAFAGNERAIRALDDKDRYPVQNCACDKKSHS
jgi:hypothetical protein